MGEYKIGVVVGSLRKDSYNRKTANAIIEQAPQNMSFEFLDIGNLPFFNEDLENQPPKEWEDFRAKIKGMDAFLFFTPEYNRSIPGVLKNAIDVGSRPYGQNSWNNKPAGVVSVSISQISGLGANHHLRQSLVFVNMHTMSQPEAYIGNAGGLYDDNGKVSQDDTRKFFHTFINAFEQWIGNFVKK